jgi:uncharacterized repeat protein (TIGR01451 family)
VIRAALAASAICAGAVLASGGIAGAGPIPKEDAPNPQVNSADMALAETAPAGVAAGFNVNWTFTVRNNGPAAAEVVTVSDTLPAGLSFASSTPADCASAPGNAVLCNLGTVPADTDLQIILTTFVASSLPAGTVLTNSGTVASTTPDPDPSNNTASATAPASVLPADVSITKTAPPVIVPGANAVWTIGVGNAGPGVANDVVITDGLPPGLTFVSSESSSGISCSASGTIVTCAVGVLGPGGSMSVMLTTKVASDVAAGAVIGNSASVASSTPDPDLSNNSVGPVNAPPAQPAADLSITKTAPAAPVVAGADATWTIVVSNAGPSDAQAVTVIDKLPSSLSFVSSSPADCTATGSTVSCALGTLASGGSDTVQLVTLVGSSTRSGTVIRNAASVSSSTPDPNLSNNTTPAVAAPPVSGNNTPLTGPVTKGAGGGASGSGSVPGSTTGDSSGTVQPQTAAAGSASALAFTGFDARDTALGGVALILAGAGLAVGVRRRARRRRLPA